MVIIIFISLNGKMLFWKKLLEFKKKEPETPQNLCHIKTGITTEKFPFLKKHLMM